MIVEGTAGNTGIGLALVGNARGYRTVIVMPDTQSQEKKDMLRLCGAELREVPAVPYKDPNNYVHVSERLAKELNGLLGQPVGQHRQPRGPHRSTGPGDLGADRRQGRRLHLRDRHRRNARRRVALPEGAEPEHPDRRADPHGRGDVQLVQARRAQGRGSSITEGIGQGA